MKKIDKKIRIVLADEHDASRQSLKTAFENNPRFEVLADCADNQKAQLHIQQLKPDIFIMDLTRSPAQNLALAESIIKKYPEVKVVGMSVSNRPSYAKKMIELGGKGYLTKTSPLTEIYEGIIQVYENKIFICEEIRSRMN